MSPNFRRATLKRLKRKTNTFIKHKNDKNNVYKKFSMIGIFVKSTTNKN